MVNKKGRFYSRYVIEKELRHHVVEWSATVLSIFAAIVNAVKYVEGFYVFAVADVLWMMFAIKHKHWGLLCLNIVYFFINIYAAWFWTSTGFGKSLF
ncbi:MAG: hypothetical protein AABX66_01435 [Nanoarchaeota archaeon]